ncbi:hypothetical protein [Shewanella algae]|uniref:hypothetical protein n=1 Tax=Shewanella algae TaxID=38313 RepID=UPI001BF06769|nr:hypothetical protein [Shewanella algae]BCV28491.1 hypothetical protein TUM3811_23510 [Shewanella algae]
MLQLAITTGWTIDYVESLDKGTIQDLQALNMLSPFLYSTASNERARLASFIYNSNVMKSKDMLSASDIFPYIKQELPQELENNELVILRSKINELSSIPNEEIRNKQKQFLLDKITEEIESRNKDVSPDLYLLHELHKYKDQLSK